jgi:hypothetical protein
MDDTAMMSVALKWWLTTLVLGAVALVSSIAGLWWLALFGAMLVGLLWPHRRGLLIAVLGIAVGWAGILVYDAIVGRDVQGAAVVIGQVALLGSTGIATYLLTLLSVIVISIPPWWFGREVRSLVASRRSAIHE